MRAPHPSEHKLQVALMDYLYVAGRKDIRWFAIPNGGFRGRNEASRLKAEGVRAGVPDLCFILPEGRSAWLEMKTKIGKLSSAQKDFRDALLALGHHWAMARSVDEAIPHLTAWGVLKSAYKRGPNFFSTDHLAIIQKPAKEKAA
jgi:hypothetical protein